MTKRYVAVQTVEEAVRAVSQTGATIFAGGTDLMPRWFRNLVPKPTAVVDIKGVEQLQSVKLADGEVSVGACVLMSELETHPTIRAAAPILAEAAARVACPQIRNRATVGGNLCNGSPAADTAVPLILLDAVLDVASSRSGGIATREIPIAGFFRAPGSTALQPGEVLTCIRFKPLPAESFWAWEKFGTRPAMEIAVASVGVVLRRVEGRVVEARVGYGSVAPVPLRGRQAESALIGQSLSREVVDRCVTAAGEEISPITDVRASQGYRREIVGVLLRRMLENAASS
ncbi:MAG: xanthine dehydrogenase family protein subunit M [Phycisphaerales bacterium]|nr:xanthine dehydrogenase family protein subunit M [Phycisphaerales bacterium]